MADGLGLGSGQPALERDALLYPVAHRQALAHDWLASSLHDDRLPCVCDWHVALEGSEALYPRHPARACLFDQRGKDRHAVRGSRGMQNPTVVFGLKSLNQGRVIDLAGIVRVVFVEV